MWRQLFVSSRKTTYCCRLPQLWLSTTTTLSQNVRSATSTEETTPTESNDELTPQESSRDTFGTMSPKLLAKQNQRLEKNEKLQRLSAKTYKEAQAMKNLKLALSKNGPGAGVEGKDTGNWKEIFGTLAAEEMKMLQVQMKAEEEDQAEPEHVPLRPRGRHTPNWYGMQMEKLAKEGKIYEAIEMFEVKMLKEDRVHPTRYTFTTLIGILGRAGYTKKAFKLYNQMKKFGLEPQKHTYTALFNACANSPFRQEALEQADKLRQQLAEKGVVLSVVTYRAMIKAYGLLGQLDTAFQIADEMVQLKYVLDGAVFHHLLIPCISDKDAGFTHAIHVWRRMRKRGVTPETGHYNLLLRAARDCGMGDPDTMNTLLQRSPAHPLPHSDAAGHLTTQPTDPDTHTDTLLKIEPMSVSDESIQHTNSHNTDSKSWWQQDLQGITSLSLMQKNVPMLPKGMSVQDLNVPNILNPRGLHWNTVGLLECPSSEHRLALLGGVPGVLSHMARDKCKPDIKTFTMLLEMLPAEPEAEVDLIMLLNKHRVKHCPDFFNSLIRRRNLRHNYDEAKEVLRMMSQAAVAPNIQTFGCLAMGCYQQRDGRQLLQDIKNAGLYPNVEVMGILMHRAGQDWTYKMLLCKTMTQLRIKPNKLLLKHIESHRLTALQAIVKQEKGKATPHHMTGEKFKEDFGNFMKFYKKWLLDMEVEEEMHPWQQFEQPHPETLARQQELEEKEILDSVKYVISA